MKNNSGAALITAIIVVTVIGFLGVIVAALFVSKTASTTDRLSSVRAQFIAEGGLEKGIKGYRADCDNHAGEANVALGGGQFTINLSTTAFDGTTLPDVQKRISSTGNIAGAVKKVEQIVACSAPLTVPLAIATVTTSVGG
ncbi:MAG: hypothetical protein FNP40_08145, partial [Dehalobacter sp. 4CP]|nr:hypothetical protein [Dehalobacter sp. 4CP]